MTHDIRSGAGPPPPPRALHRMVGALKNNIQRHCAALQLEYESGAEGRGGGGGEDDVYGNKAAKGHYGGLGGK